MTSFHVRVDHADTGHINVSLFAGKDEDHRARCGTLSFEPREFRDFWMTGGNWVMSFIATDVEVDFREVMAGLAK